MTPPKEPIIKNRMLVLKVLETNDKKLKSELDVKGFSNLEVAAILESFKHTLLHTKLKITQS